MTSRRLLALLAVAAALLSGCGGGSSEQTQAEFQQSVVQARDRVDFALARIPKATSLDEYLNRMDEAAVVIEHAADDLAAVHPPALFQPDTEKLVKAFHQLSVDYRGTADQIRSTPELLAGARGLSFDSWDQANLALADMVGKGIDVTVLQPHL